VKFHQTAINQKLNLTDDAIFIVSQHRKSQEKSRESQPKNHLKVIKMKKDGREIYGQSLDVFSFWRRRGEHFSANTCSGINQI
jgi:hypothetical protein